MTKDLDYNSYNTVVYQEFYHSCYQDDLQTNGSYDRMIGLIKCNGKILNEVVLESGHGEISMQFCKTSEFENSNWAQKYGC